MAALTMRNALAVLLCLLLSFAGFGQKPIAPTGRNVAAAHQQDLTAERQRHYALVDSLIKLMALPPFEHPVLRAIDKEQAENLEVFSNPISNALVVACAVDRQSRIAYFFTCYGKVTDFVFLKEDEYLAVVMEKKWDVFQFYTAYRASYIDQINQATRELQLHGIEAAKKQNRSPYFNNPVVEEAKTSLEKLLVLDRCRQEMIQQLVNTRHEIMVYDLADSVRRSLHSPSYKAGACRTGGSGDSAWGEYFNQNPFSPVEKAVISGAKAMIFIHDKNGSVDSFPIKKEGISKMLGLKTNPFVLYRGWLEWQLQGITTYLDSAEAKQGGSSGSMVQNASTVDEGQRYLQWRQAVRWQRHWQACISRLMMPNESMMAVQESMDGARTWGKRQLRWIGGERFHITTGYKRYELTDHRGNVVAVVTDRRTGVDKNGDGQVEHYEPEVISAVDYSPFGSPMEGRSYNKDKYRYGYNGKENDGETGAQDYGMRIYDPRLGRFLSVDPLYRDYPWYSSYQFAGNDPVRNTDLDGGEPQSRVERWKHNITTISTYDDPQLGVIGIENVYDIATNRNWFIHEGNDGQRWYWKHKEGIKDQSVLIQSRDPKRANGSWHKYQTANQIESDKIMKDRSLHYIMAGVLLTPAAICVGIPAAPEIASAGIKSRLVSASWDYASQAFGNYLGGKRGWDVITDVNATSLAVAFGNPGNSILTVGLNNGIASLYSYSSKSGANGVLNSESKTFGRALFEMSVGTLMGYTGNRLTSSIQGKLSKVNSSIDYLNGLGIPSNSSLPTLRTLLNGRNMLNKSMDKTYFATSTIGNSINTATE
ncbi:RHS repeat-associated core domain-containing protein [Paraflavisolibacter sp. H34]|uniref:RHS repeat domain-containing protein n=1 Tax=Huijunlia imazamoxiresistens TaxID=3127457 RepID=UPI003017CFFC